MNYIKIGFTKKTVGTKGELKITIDPKYLEDISKTNVVFLKLGNYIPFFIEKVKLSNSSTILFEDVTSETEAAPFSSKEIYLRDSDILKEEERTKAEEDPLEFGYLNGFVIHDIREGKIGQITEIQQFPQQEMAIVNFKENDIMIPLNDNFIVNVDGEKKIVKMDLPEGLLGL